MSYFDRSPNKNGVCVPVTFNSKLQEIAVLTCLSALELDTNEVGTRSVELYVVSAGENLSENGWLLACEHADSYSATNGAYLCSPCGESGDSHLCDECGAVCDENDDEYEGVAYVFYRWQLSVSGSYIGGGLNDGDVIEALLTEGGLEKSEDSTEWTFCVGNLRKLVDLSVNEASELKYLEEMITGCYIAAKVFHYV